MERAHTKRASYAFEVIKKYIKKTATAFVCLCFGTSNLIYFELNFQT